MSNNWRLEILLIYAILESVEEKI